MLVKSPAPFRTLYAPPDAPIAARLLAAAQASADAPADHRIDARATRLIGAIRTAAGDGGLGGIEDVLREYALSTKEGLALMVLAEALLRVPDSATTDRLIEDKLSGADWAGHVVKSNAMLVSASAWVLGVTARIVHQDETPEGILSELTRRIGRPAVRAATRQAMRVLGRHFVIGQTITEALARAADERQFRYSFDMLGEGARTAADAAHYRQAYADAIAAIGAAAGNAALPARPGISVKLSALHPQFTPLARDRVLRELPGVLLDLARSARAHDLNFTVDAEEADRLELSLDVIRQVLADPSLRGWDGFGLAIQAYQKRAEAVIAWTHDIATALDRRLMVRLVKGAYWDAEIKRAQERGLADYPVFTRKPMTDLNYAACIGRLLAARPRLLPQFATHNALTVATVVERAGGTDGYEFQRLYGMGEALYDALLDEFPDAACRVYAPVGGHRDLLAYLVRRLLENGANASFVSQAADPAVPVESLLRRPQAAIGDPAHARHPRIPLPPDLYAPARRNAAGVEFGDDAALTALLAEIAAAADEASAAPVIDGTPAGGLTRDIVSPIDGARIGTVTEARPETAAAAMRAASAGFPAWAANTVETRAAALDRAAALFEARRGLLLGLLQREAGKTIDDAVAELREAVDFCRYYAAEARRTLAPQPLPGPTGESNALHQRGRGVFVCIAPWNFPLAIFVGQVAAALVAGNAVAAKPAEQTPLIAAAAIALLHAAGIPPTALHLLPGDGAIGAALVADPHCAGVAFTGSTSVAQTINRALAARDGPIVPLIAETGGINAMIVDATALPEQVTDDVVSSAFRSAGQRCSALRLLCLQDDVADRMLAMIEGAASELAAGDPRDPGIQVGPVIDREARDRLEGWIAAHAAQDRLRFRGEGAPGPCFVAPAIITLERARDLTEEVFGPVLHVVRYRADALPALLDEIAQNRTGLTLGVHSRIDATVQQVVDRMPHGNVYVNRNMIGAVVGTQPFGGTGLSGTGPKAGGPHYLPRFCAEQVVTNNTAAAGGNASLLAASED